MTTKNAKAAEHAFLNRLFSAGIAASALIVVSTE